MQVDFAVPPGNWGMWWTLQTWRIWSKVINIPDLSSIIHTKIKTSDIIEKHFSMYKSPLFSVFYHRVFSAIAACSPKYDGTQKIICSFHLTNNDHRDYSALKWRTPLSGMTFDFLTVMYKGKRLDYDGIFMKRRWSVLVRCRWANRLFDVWCFRWVWRKQEWKVLSCTRHEFRIYTG